MYLIKTEEILTNPIESNKSVLLIKPYNILKLEENNHDLR